MDLKEVLIDAGLTLPFSRAANLSGMTGDETLQFFDVFQKARLEMDEAGIKATAVHFTSFCSKGGSPSKNIVEMTVNHPYILLLRDKAQEVTLFAAVITNPAAE